MLKAVQMSGGLQDWASSSACFGYVHTNHDLPIVLRIPLIASSVWGMSIMGNSLLMT